MDKAQSGISRVQAGDFQATCPCDQGKRVSLTVTLPNEQLIEESEALVLWSKRQEFAVENMLIELHTSARLQHYVKRLVQEPTEIVL
jgi:hypothetical protein